MLIAYSNSAWKNTYETQISYQGTKFIFAIELLTQPGTCGGDDSSGGRIVEWWDDHGSFASMRDRVFQRI